MKYHYYYRNKENAVCDGWVEAADRNAVYAALREKGVKPFKVVGKNPWVVGGWWFVVGVIVAAVGAAVIAGKSTRSPGQDSVAGLVGRVPRHQIYGDRAIIESGIKSDWAECGFDEGEKILARFAQPGTSAIIPGTAETAARVVAECLKRKLKPAAGDLLEYAQIKSIVESMKDEARQFVKEGDTVEGYLDGLIDRQKQEMAFYNAAQQDVTNARETMGEDEFTTFWREKNAELRSIGVKTIPYPGED